jgi:hypothetical protein
VELEVCAIDDDDDDWDVEVEIFGESAVEVVVAVTTVVMT